MKDLIMSLVESGLFDIELGQMTQEPENADLKVSEIKKRLGSKISSAMAVETESGPLLWKYGMIGVLIMLLALFISLLLDIDLRELL